MHHFLDFDDLTAIYYTTIQSSFAIIHKVDNVDIFVLLQIENILDREINHFSIQLKAFWKMYLLSNSLVSQLLPIYFH